MGPAFAVAVGLQKLGVVCAAALAAGVFVLPSPRGRAAAMAGALALVPILLLGEVWGSDQLQGLRGDGVRLAALALVALAAVAALGYLFDRRPTAFPLACMVALPFRVPVDLGTTSANLLVPLYLVIAAGCVAYIAERLRNPDSAAEREGTPGRLELVLVAVVSLYAVQSLYSADFSKALEQFVFFLVPFMLLFKLLLRINWTLRLVVACFGVLVGLAVCFTLIGFWEYHNRSLIWNPKVIDANAFSAYFRVNSAFYDPNIYGRFLAVVITCVAAVLIFSEQARALRQWALVAVLALLWGGMIVTFSQSSLAALLVGLAVLAALRWDWRRALAASLVLLVAAVAFALAFQGALKLDLERFRSVNNATSGRLELVQGGLRLFAARPLAGWGSGSFSREYRAHERSGQQAAVSASHTIPLTVAAEQGVVGLAAYLALLWVSFMVLLRGARAPPEEESLAAPARAFGAARAAIAAAFAVLVVHTQLYAAFLEDPLAWALLGVGLALARQGQFAAVVVRAPAEAEPAPAG